MIKKEKKKYTYWDFHFENLGYSYYSLFNGKTMSKIEIYSRFQDDEKTLKLIGIGQHPNYKKINSKGWENGEQIFCGSKTCEKRFDCHRFQNKKHDSLIYNLKNNYECGLFEFTKKN